MVLTKGLRLELKGENGKVKTEPKAKFRQSS